jgi:EmrB/QacA subfamily drug resistance transporter
MAIDARNDTTQNPDEAQQQNNNESSPMNQTSKLERVLIVLALCMALAALDTTIITTAIPSITSHFGSSAGYIWIGAAFLLAYAACVPLWGKLSDIFGRKPSLLSAVGIFWVGSLLCAVSVSMAMLVAARAVQGIEAGGLVVLPNICIADLFSLRTRGIFYGVMGMVWAVASTLGPVLGGVFATKATWRWCFYINLRLSGIAMLILSLFLKMHNPRTPIKQGLAAIDWTGSILIIGGVLMLFLGLELGGTTFPWESATTICLIVFGLVAIVLYVVNEAKFAKYPITPAILFKHRTSALCYCLAFIHAVIFMAGNYWLPLYFQSVMGASPLQSGVYILPFAVAIAFSEISVGFYNKKTGHYKIPIIIGMADTTLGYGLFIDLGWHENWYKIIIYQIIAGLALGLNFQSPLVALQTDLEASDMGSATATFSFLRQLGTSTAVTIGGVILNNEMSQQYSHLEHELGPDLAHAFAGSNAAKNVELIADLNGQEAEIAKEAYWNGVRVMFIVFAAFSGLGSILTPWIRQVKLSDDHQEHRTRLETLRSSRR